MTIFARIICNNRPDAQSDLFAFILHEHRDGSTRKTWSDDACLVSDIDEPWRFQHLPALTEEQAREVAKHAFCTGQNAEQLADARSISKELMLTK